jgi:hypothetical protein
MEKNFRVYWMVQGDGKDRVYVRVQVSGGCEPERQIVRSLAAQEKKISLCVKEIQAA